MKVTDLTRAYLAAYREMREAGATTEEIRLSAGMAPGTVADLARSVGAEDEQVRKELPAGQRYRPDSQAEHLLHTGE